MEYVDSVKKFYFNDLKKSLKKPICTKVNLKNNRQEINEERSPTVNDVSTLPKKDKQVEVVVFKQRKNNESNSMEDAEPSKKQFAPDKNLIKAQKLLKQIEWDVTQFGMKGFSLSDKRKLEQERAINLGAKPPKNKYINYKILMEERKKQNKNSDSRVRSSSKKNQRRKKQAPTVFWKDSTSTGRFGQVGRFNGGVLKLSRRDVKTLHPNK